MFRPDCSLSAFCLLCFSLLHRQKGAGNLPGGCPQSTVDKSIFWCQSSASPLGSFEDGLLHARDWAGFGSAGSREAVQQIWRCGGVGSSAFGSLQRGWGFGESRSANQRRASLLFWECEPWVAVAEELLSSVLYIQMLLGISAGIAWTAGDEVLILAALCWKCTCNWHLIKYECFSLGG